MLGYGTETKAYRLYDIERQRVIFSRDVIFNESKTGFEKEPVSKDSDTEYVQLECSNENHGESSHEEGKQESTQQEIPDIILQCSTRKRKMPDYYGNRVTVADTSADPKSWKEAMASTDKEKWVVAMEKEMESLHANEVWNLVELPKDRKAVGRIKHIAIKYHFIKEQVSSGKLELKYCKTNDMIADMLTKGLSGEQFEKLRLMAGVTSIIEHSESNEKEC